MEFPTIKTQDRRATAKVATSPSLRLGVGHLMLWIVCCCAYLAVVRHLRAESPTPLRVFLIIVATAIDGTALAGFVLFVYRRRRRFMANPEPGEWLLAILGARLVLYLLLQTWLEPVFRAPSAVLAGATCLFLVLPTLDRRLPDRWKILFGVLVIVYLLPMIDVGWSVFGSPPAGIGILARWLNGARNGIVAVLVLGLSVIDRRIHKRAVQAGSATATRSWLHWLGIADCLAMVASALLLGRV